MLRLSPTRTIIRGDSDKFKLSFVKSDIVKNKEVKTPIDITDWNIKFTVRPAVPDSSIVDDDDALIAEEATLVNPEEGIAVVYVQSEQTTQLLPGIYLYDIQVIRPEDEFGFNEVQSTRRGKYVVLGDITRHEKYPVIEPEEPDVDYNDETNTLILNTPYMETNGNIIVDKTRVVSDTNNDVVFDKEATVNQSVNKKDYVEDDADDDYDI